MASKINRIDSFELPRLGCVWPQLYFLFNDSLWRDTEGSAGPFVGPPLFPLSSNKATCGHLTFLSLISFLCFYRLVIKNKD